MLRSLAQSRARLVGEICRQNASRLLSSSAQQAAGAAPEAGVARSSALKRFFFAVVPIGLIAAALEHAHKQAEPEPAASAGAGVQQGPAAAAVAAEHDHHARATIHGGVTSHGVEIDPSNPLHKLLPETECEFCLETREKLWGMVKSMKHEKKGPGAHAAKRDASSSSGGEGGGSGSSEAVAGATPAAASAAPRV